jgi:hypothetical protein
MPNLTGKSHALRKPIPFRVGQQAAPAWPSYSGTSELVGTTPSGRVTVFVDPTLGEPGAQNARDLLSDADRVVQANDAIFGTRGGSVSVIVFALDGQTDGSGGADHNGCDYASGGAIEACASYGNSARVSALFEAELSECSMGGNLCGVSTGEALSRWCAAETSNNALADFATAPTWAASGMINWVDRTEPTDRQAVSTGCGMAFISWLISQGFGLDVIAPAMVSLGDAGTLSQLYAHLTGHPASSAWSAFRNAVKALPNGVTSDDPFGDAPQPASVTFSQEQAAMAGRIFSAILSDVSAGAHAEKIVTTVNAIMRSSQAGASCTIGSRRLRPMPA